MTLTKEEAERLRQIESELHDMANARLIETYGVPVSFSDERNQAADEQRIQGRYRLLQLAMELRLNRQANLPPEAPADE